MLLQELRIECYKQNMVATCEDLHVYDYKSECHSWTGAGNVMILVNRAPKPATEENGWLVIPPVFSETCVKPTDTDQGYFGVEKGAKDAIMCDHVRNSRCVYAMSTDCQFIRLLCAALLPFVPTIFP